jgi:hypothetical protein
MAARTNEWVNPLVIRRELFAAADEQQGAQEHGKD